MDRGYCEESGSSCKYKLMFDVAVDTEVTDEEKKKIILEHNCKIANNIFSEMLKQMEGF